ncbi:MAG: hypothetical protein AB7T03_01725 [Bacilli bacterium]
MNEEIKTQEQETIDEKAIIKEKIFEIEIKLQEIDAIIERAEDEFYHKENEQNEVSPEETQKLIELKNEYRTLVKQKKQLQKSLKSSVWDNFPVWIGLYAVFQLIFSFYLILTQISTYFAQWFFTVINGSTEFAFYVSLFIIPFLNLVLSLVIWLIIKNKLHKKIFLYVYLIHGIETLMAVGVLLYVVLK